MSEFMDLPRLELCDTSSPFDEAVIIIDGLDEDTITIEMQDEGCALELANQLIRLVNNYDLVVKALTAASHALRSYQHGNAAPDLARDLAAHCDDVRQQIGAAA